MSVREHSNSVESCSVTAKAPGYRYEAAAGGLSLLCRLRMDSPDVYVRAVLANINLQHLNAPACHCPATTAEFLCHPRLGSKVSEQLHSQKGTLCVLDAVQSRSIPLGLHPKQGTYFARALTIPEFLCHPRLGFAEERSQIVPAGEGH